MPVSDRFASKNRTSGRAAGADGHGDRLTHAVHRSQAQIRGPERASASETGPRRTADAGRTLDCADGQHRRPMRRPHATGCRPGCRRASRCSGSASSSSSSSRALLVALRTLLIALARLAVPLVRDRTRSERARPPRLAARRRDRPGVPHHLRSSSTRVRVRDRVGRRRARCATSSTRRPSTSTASRTGSTTRSTPTSTSTTSPTSSTIPKGRPASSSKTSPGTR